MSARNSQYTVTPAARADLDSIWHYTAETGSAEQAERYTDQIIDAFEAIAADPTRGRDASQTRAGYRYWAAGRHFVFYRLTDGIPEIMRVLHQRRDFVRHV